MYTGKLDLTNYLGEDIFELLIVFEELSPQKNYS